MTVQQAGTQQFIIRDAVGQYYTVYTDSKTSGKVVSVVNNSTSETLTRSQAVSLLNSSVSDSLNKQFRTTGGVHKEYTNANNVLAPQTQYDSTSTNIDKAIANISQIQKEAGAAFQTQNLKNVESLTKKQTKTSGVIVFPSDLIVKSESGGVQYSQDTIRIKALKYVPPQKDFLEGVFNTGSFFTQGTVSNNQEFNGYEQLNALIKNYDQRGEVILPMPLAIRDAVGAEWGIDTVNSLALGLYSSIRNVYELDPTGILPLARTGVTPLRSLEAFGHLSAAYLGAGDGGIRTQVLNNLTRDILGSLGPDFKVDPLNALARSSGSVVNNNAELLFRGPKLRSFDCAWKLSPRSSDDALRIRKMIRWFKINSLPYISETGAIFMETPNVFAVQYTKANNQRNEALPQFKLCALLDFRVDYAPDGVGWAAYEDDSQPITSLITATFHELTPLFANEYANMPEDSVGY